MQNNLVLKLGLTETWLKYDLDMVSSFHNIQTYDFSSKNHVTRTSGEKPTAHSPSNSESEEKRK